MMYKPSFLKTGSAIQKLIRWDTDIRTHRQQGDLTSLLLFLQNEESKLKICESRLENIVYNSTAQYSI
jgi:hypothetical protein